VKRSLPYRADKFCPNLREKDGIASDYVPGVAIHLPPNGTAAHDERWLTVGNA